MNMNRFRMMLVISVLALVGCGGGDKPIDVTPPTATPAAQNAKLTLEEIATTGQMGSGMMLLRENIEEIKRTDEAKGAPLLSELDALEKETDAAAIKAKAKAMADKL
jgi:hypothetical protein